MSTHPQEITDQFTGQRCGDCHAAYTAQRVCGNPCCVSNPDLSPAHIARIQERSAQMRRDRVARNRTRKMQRLSYGGRS